ncbi:hypothetical protein N7495_009525 [Penicillium taxi]|uniref:uncharacterized protein n=1 Tax=Penicillium taxi TaxID=168475 RepID=UPI002544D4A5|nr:uncharacterized protein N7495_009525 [Penicillium taxi]KAJ5885015.1 hypothetical protein N7495_009525 [Penicillium taxi]
MANSEPVHFFDIASILPGSSKSWSPNTLKVRAALNFKGIPYTQSFISYPDIAPLLESLDVEPNKIGTPYTLPAIIHKSSISSNPHGAMIDSLPIVLHLDKVFPTTSLFPSGDASYALALAVNRIISVEMRGFYVKYIIPNIADKLDPRGHEYFVRTRTESFGKPLAEMRPTDPKVVAEEWKAFEAGLKPVLEILRGREGKKGPFFEGDKAGYADLILACHFAWFDRADPELFKKFIGYAVEFQVLWDACRPWLEGQGEEKEWPIPGQTN